MKNLRKLIEKDPYLKGVKKVLLASSGGIDSMCLAALLKDIGIPFDVAHMNYQLRGAASDDDQHFLFTWCLENRITFLTKIVNIDHQKGNIQQKARDLRYEWLEKLFTKKNYDLILTAHHADDQLEGVFIKIWRGVEWQDRYLMPARRGKIYRPLVNIFRDEIEEWVGTNNIPYVEDETNRSADKYDRNFIRLRILKGMEEQHPGSKRLLHEKFLREDSARGMYHWMLTRLFKEHAIVTADGWNLDLNTLSLLEPPDLPTLLGAIISKFRFHPEIARQILNSDTGAFWENQLGKLWLDRGKLIFSNNRNAKIDGQSISIKASGTYSLLDTKWKIDEHQFIAPEGLSDFQLFVDKANFPFPWTIRNWRFGDVISPLGMAGKHKKLKDIFTDQKISRADKKIITFLEIDNEIIWIPGIKKSEKLSKVRLLSSGWLITVEPKA